MWTKKQLQDVAGERLSDYQLVIASNREPYQHTRQKGQVSFFKSTGGVVHALDPVMQACRGVWVAHGSGDADQAASDAQGRVQVPPDNPMYTLKRVWLTKAEEQGYYYGFANEALWPLCHIVFSRPIFRESDWQAYCAVNRKFADAIVEEVGNRKTFVWIQDYHLALLAKYLKERAPNILTAHFWHIPWPNSEAFRICPKRLEILDGLLSNNLLGFHTRYHCDNFLATISRELEAKVDRERSAVTRRGHRSLVRPFPISVDYEAISTQAKTHVIEEHMTRIRDEYRLEEEQVIIGVDRIDYTKGLIERLHAFSRLLDKYPEHVGQVTMLQLGQLSRIHLPLYKRLNDEINDLVEAINWQHGSPTWTPVRLVRRRYSDAEITAFYRVGHVCLVSSLHDGMNLVCKEYVAARTDRDGVLVLSRFTGAARELTDALLVNPYDTEVMADQLHEALIMPAKERKQRMTRLRKTVKQNNIYRWAGRMLSELVEFEFEEKPRPALTSV